MKTQTVDIKEVKLNPDNPRTIEKSKLEGLIKSIKEFPEMLKIRPIVVDENYIALGGNKRLEACIAAGLQEVEIIVASDLTEEQKREFIIKDNLSFGEWDFERLAEDWEKDILESWGFDQLENILDKKEVENKTEDDAVPEVPEKPESELGKIYQLGKHRLMCGDSTSEKDVAELMGGDKADLAHNDPPYGMKKENEGVLNDNLNYSDLLKFNKLWIDLQFEHLKENGSFYCWGTDEPLMDIYSEILKPMISKQKATFRNLITWDKGNGQGQLAEGFRSYPIADEKCLFVMCGVQGFNNNADNYFHGWDSIVDYLKKEKEKTGLTIKDFKRIAGHSENSGCHWFDKSQWMMPTEETYKAWQNHCKKEYDAFKKEYDELKKEYDELKKEYYSTRSHFNNTHDNMNNVWDFKRTSTSERETTGGHATPKPIELCERVVLSSCPDGGLVIDVFGGSGSTLIACEKTNRKCYMMELDTHYCDVIRKRWAEYVHGEGCDWISLTASA